MGPHTVRGPSVGHPELLAHFLFNCYKTSYTASSTLYLHIYQLFFLTKKLIVWRNKTTLVHHAGVTLSKRGWRNLQGGVRLGMRAHAQ